MRRAATSTPSAVVAFVAFVALVAPEATALAQPSPPTSTESVTVVGRPAERREPNQTTVTSEDARHVAGSQDDAVRVVQALPGVARPRLGSGDLAVWGAAPSETRFTIDGVEIPFAFHPSGVRGVVPSDLLASVELVPGGYGAAYGRGLGGIYRLETCALREKEHARVAFDTLDGSARVGFPLGSRTRATLAVRKSWLDAFVRLVGADDTTELFPVPKYADAQAKLSVDVRSGESLDVVALGASGGTSRSVASPDPEATRVATSDTAFGRIYARYSSVTPATTTLVVPFVGRDVSDDTRSFGASGLSPSARLARGSTIYGVRASTKNRPVPWLAFTTGVDILGASTDVSREGSLTIPPREGDAYVFGQPPGADVGRDDYTVQSVDLAPFAHADVRLGPVTLSPGVRFDAYLIEGSRSLPRVGDSPPIGFSRLEPALAPRVAARVRVTERLDLSASFGRYHEAPRPEDLSAVFGTPELGLARATHVTFGETLRITDATSLELVGFAKDMSDLTVRSRLPNPRLGRALTQNGEGRAVGAQWLFRVRTTFGLSGWIAYTLSRSERRNVEDTAFRRFDFDQPHVLAVVATQTLGGFTFGLRFRASSGYPYTPVVGRAYDARADRYDPVVGALGSARLPTFWQLDARVDRTFALGRGATATTYLDVVNVTATKNIEEMAYASTFDERRPIQGLPTIAIVGARIER